MKVNVAYVTKKGETRNLIIRVDREIVLVEIDVD